MQDETSRFVQLGPGSAAPWFRQRTPVKPDYNFSTAAGRYLAICFFGTLDDETGRRTMDMVRSSAGLFNETHAAFFGVTIDPRDETERRIVDQTGIRFFLDFDARVSRLYGAAPVDGAVDKSKDFRRLWFILDPTMRIMAVLPIEHTREVLEMVARLPPPGHFAGIRLQAPILYLPNVFEAGFCRHLIALHDGSDSAEISGVMREVDGKTVAVRDTDFKVRRDYYLEDDILKKEVAARIKRSIVPEIAKVHHFKVTRLERYLVGCYAAEDNAHFWPHRDNTTKGTAHRRFAVSINLNADFDGGEIWFPEYGEQSFKPPPGCAVVFSCSLLHAVKNVTRGKRYAFLPFLYDEAAATLRDTNRGYLAEG